MNFSDIEKKWPKTKKRVFDTAADYSQLGVEIETFSLLDDDIKKLSHVNCHLRTQKNVIIEPAKVLGPVENISAYSTGNMTFDHGVFEVGSVEMVSPNGTFFSSNGIEKKCIRETMWQSAIAMHEDFRINKSTKWKLREVKNFSRDRYDTVEETVLSAYHRFYHQYFHWIIDVMPRFWLAQKAGFLDQPIFAGPLPELGFQRAMLHALGIRDDQFIFPTSERIKFKNAIIPVSKLTETLKVRPSFKDGIHHKGGWDPEFMAWVSDLCRKIPNYQNFDVPSPERIYVDRSNAGHRRIKNAHILEDYLHEKGFIFIDPGMFNVAEQHKLFSNARIVVGAHGAGLSNIIWADPKNDVSVLEFSPIGLSDTGYSFISSGLGFNHSVLYGQPVQRDMDVAWCDIEIDFNLAIKTINEMM